MVLTGRTGAMIFIAPVRFFVLPQREQQRLHAPAGIRFARSRSSGDCTSLPLRGEGGESNFLRKLFSPDEVEHRISTDVPPQRQNPAYPPGYTPQRHIKHPPCFPYREPLPAPLRLYLQRTEKLQPHPVNGLSLGASPYFDLIRVRFAHPPSPAQGKAHTSPDESASPAVRTAGIARSSRNPLRPQ